MSMVDEFRKRLQDRIQSVRANIEQFRPGLLREGGLLSHFELGNLMDVNIGSGQIIQNIQNRIQEIRNRMMIGQTITEKRVSFKQVDVGQPFPPKKVKENMSVDI